MFRTSNNRGQERFDLLQQLKTDKSARVVLSHQQIKLIENSQVLSLGEKIELLLLSLGNKLTTEIYFEVKYEWSERDQKDVPSAKTLNEITSLLEKLPFFYFRDTLLKKNRQTGHQENFTWFQVSINEAVTSFMRNFPDDLTEFEEGVLYGFPLSAIRAYAGLITPKYDKSTPAVYYLSGVCSEEFWEDEVKYYEKWWAKLRKLSPKTVSIAEAKFIDN